MQASTDSSTRQIRLNCLDDRPAPPLVTEGWNRLNAFAPSAREPFWMLMVSLLLKPDSGVNKELITLFCKQQKSQPEDVLAAVGCCELLLKQSASLDLSTDRFQQDLEALSGRQAEDLVDFIVQRFPEIKNELRRQILMDSLATHGKVMTGLEWRLDKVQHSSKGNHLNTDIVLLTLHFQEGAGRDRITLQLTRDAAMDLRKFTERIPASNHD